MSYLLKIVFDEEKADKDQGIQAVSIVSEPAILTNFIALKKTDDEKLQLSLNEEQRIITGPLLIPNIKMYRSKEQLNLDKDGYIMFDGPTVRKLAYNFLANERNNRNTIEHNGERVDAFRLIESWIIEDTKRDKSAVSPRNFELPAETWMSSYKVIDDKIWKEIKAGRLNGFSIEGFLDKVIISQLSKMTPEEKEKLLFEDQEDERPVLEQAQADLLVDHCKRVGKTVENMEEDGWIFLEEDGELTEEGESFIGVSLALAITANPQDKSKLDKFEYSIRYKYAVGKGLGPMIVPDITRPFCTDMVNANLIYRKEDIQSITHSGYHGYNIFEQKGGKYCRHRFARLVYVRANPKDKDYPGKRLPGSSALPNKAIPHDKRATNPNPSASKKYG